MSWATAPAWHGERNGSSLLPPCPGSQSRGRTVWGEEKTSLGEDVGGEDAARGGLDSCQHFASVSIFASAGRPAASFLLLEGRMWSRKSPTIFFFSSWEFLRFIREKHSDRYQLHEAGANNERTQRWLGSAWEALREGCSLVISSTSAELRDCCDVVHQLKIKLHDFAKLTTSSSTPFETLH